LIDGAAVRDILRSAGETMLRDTLRSVWRVRGPNVGLSCLSLLSSGLGSAKTRVDDLALRVRRTRNKDVLDALYAGVSGTPPLRCNPAATTAIHTVTSHHHLRMYLTAIKSVLRYHDDVAVVVHDDGSLDAGDAAFLEHHLPGVQVIDRASADRQMEPLLARYPHSRRLRERVVNSLELFDNMLLSPTARIVNMNSDVLFLREPRDFLAWLAGGDASIAGVFEAEPAGQARLLERRGSRFPAHVTTALTCFYPDTCNLDFVEGVLAEIELDWFAAQNLYPLLYERQAAEHPSRFFDERSYQASGVFEGEAVFRHYWTSTGKFTEIQRRDSENVLRHLAARSA
jgi:hypothetical protein